MKKKDNKLNENSLNQVSGGATSNMTAHGAYGSKEWKEYYHPEDKQIIGGKDGCYHGSSELNDDALSNVSGGVSTDTQEGMIGGGDGIYNPEGSRFVGPGGINPNDKSRFVGPGGINPNNKSRFVGPGGINPNRDK